MNIVFLLYVSATRAAIFAEMHYKEWTLQNIKKVCEPFHRSRIFILILYFNMYFKQRIFVT